MTIPNIFHFINIGPREFNLVHYLSIMTAYKQNNPTHIYLYCDTIQKNNIYWDMLKNIVTIVEIVPPSYHKGILLKSYHYKADIIRMEKLLEMGGIYMDLDVLSLKPLTNFLDKNIVLGAETATDKNSINITDFESITNAVILSEPNNKFIKDWFSQIGDNLTEKPWAYHAVCLPKEILAQTEYDVTLEPKTSFMPFCFRDDYIFSTEMKHRREELHKSYTIHLWENIWKDKYISKIDIGYFNAHNNLMTELFGDYLDDIYDNLDNIIKIIRDSYKMDDSEKLYYYGKMYLDLCKRYSSKIDPALIRFIYSANNTSPTKNETSQNVKRIHKNSVMMALDEI